eukprot:gene8180-8_t
MKDKVAPVDALTSQNNMKINENENEKSVKKVMNTSKFNKTKREENEVSNKKQKVTHSHDVALHKFNFKNYKYQGIQSMCLNKKKTILAIARFNGEIQFWNVKVKQWFPFKTIPGRKETTVHGMLWLNFDKKERFYTAGLHGVVTEWDLETLSPKKTSNSFGGAIWSMSNYENHIACTTENGKILLLDKDLKFIKIFGLTKVEKVPNVEHISEYEGNRLLCSTFNSDGTRIFVGGLTGAYCYDTNSYEMKYKISIETGIVWSILHLNDSTLVVGDSSGNIHFCDSVHGVIIQTLRSSLKNDVLSMTTNERNDQIFVAGTDGIIILFSKLKNRKWEFTSKKNPHFHDIYHLQYFNGGIISGGVDGSLIYLSKFGINRNENSLIRSENFVSNEIIRYSNNSNLILLTDNDNRLYLTRLPSTEISFAEKTAEISKSPSLLVSFEPKSENGWNFSDFSISSNGEFIAVVGIDFVKLYRINGDQISDEIDLTDVIEPGHKVEFTSNSKNLIVASLSNRIQVYNIEEKKLEKIFYVNDKKRETTLNSIQSMKTQNNLLIICFNSDVYVYDLTKEAYEKNPLIDSSIGNHQIYKIASINDDQFSILREGNTLITYTLQKEGKITAVRLSTAFPILDIIPTEYDIVKCDAMRMFLGTNSEITDLPKGVCLCSQLIKENQCLLVYKPKKDIELSLPSISYRHRYGT